MQVVHPPVLLIVFNRPELTRQVVQALDEAKISKLYVFADGPRNAAEREKVEATRKAVKENYSGADMALNFQEKNLGCKLAMQNAISWFFSVEEEGVILEDDCLPSAQFFPFVTYMLNYYRNEKRVGHIAGSNLLPKPDGVPYFFSSLGFIWGWATWRDRWEKYQRSELDIPTGMAAVKKANLHPLAPYYWANRWHACNQGKIDTWDYQWQHALFTNDYLAVVPSENLIINLGFGPEATHTKGRKPKKLPVTLGAWIQKDYDPDVIAKNNFDKSVFKEFFYSWEPKMWKELLKWFRNRILSKGHRQHS